MLGHQQTLHTQQTSVKISVLEDIAYQYAGEEHVLLRKFDQ